MVSVITWTIESRHLAGNTTVTVLLPDRPRDETPREYYGEERRFKVLWLLHGTFGDNLDWLRRTNIDLYAAEKGLAVVMPSALNSNYSNWSDFSLGYDMYDFLTEELMPLVQGWLPVSDRREDNFIAGLSMGGRGTVKFAANHPELFAAAAVLSASPVEYDRVLTDELLAEGTGMFADRLRGMVANAGGREAFLASEENVWRILDAKAGSGELPRMLFACGSDDELIVGDLRTFAEHAADIGLDAEFWIADGYRHEWRFWDLAIQRALDFFGLEHNPSNPF
ncbi:MAG: alpha/beta hydrolase family protein [Candidatus Microbacterium phytovorans]|uniref:Alpha/beta hydrolase family protein n=1 Tax=Candidatus Microbacterium phytovorans TaxID=3121374 RepID=A0AAJ5W197_9MICO|nr:alpha/beta hydrolase family protein [Microbacterium sp.]WEK12781.1 MAG: alpha/beta hydrolase family protein [Microbacterium sp.]